MIPNDVYRCFLDYASAKVVYALLHNRLLHTLGSRYRERTQRRLIYRKSDDLGDYSFVPSGLFHGYVRLYGQAITSHAYYREGRAHGLSELWLYRDSNQQTYSRCEYVNGS